MVALIDKKDLIVFSQHASKSLPVVERPEQAVENNDGIAFTKYFVIQFHCKKLELVQNCTRQFLPANIIFLLDANAYSSSRAKRSFQGTSG